jgi:hypothetical protein
MIRENREEDRTGQEREMEEKGEEEKGEGIKEAKL